MSRTGDRDALTEAVERLVFLVMRIAFVGRPLAMAGAARPI
jgi:hypothetical protein